MAPLLSIIIPCFNAERFLTDAVNSVLKQPCRDWEIIIVDDGSTDSSGAIADQLSATQDNIHVFHTPKGGVSRARNVGIDRASGRYIGFLDADDVLCRNAYDQKIHSALEAGQYDILSFSHLKGMEDLSYGCMVRANAPGLYLREDPDYIRQAEKHFCSYLYRRTLFTDVIRFPAGIRYHEDVCFLFLFACSSRHIMQYEKPWFVYRMNFSSVMHRLKSADYVLEEIDAWNWCKENCTQPQDIRDCEGNIFSYMVEYIRFSCMYGVPAHVIQKNVLENEPFQKVMAYYGSFWLHARTASQYSRFMKRPWITWLPFKIKGIGYRAAQHLIRTKPGNIVNQKLRYKLPLADYLVV